MAEKTLTWISTREGDDYFIAVIEEKLNASDALVAVIGNHWLMITGEDGTRRRHGRAGMLTLLRVQRRTQVRWILLVGGMHLRNTIGETATRRDSSLKSMVIRYLARLAFSGAGQVILDGTLAGNRISFTTKSLTTTGVNCETSEEKHYYKGTIDGDAIHFAMVTDSSVSTHTPIHFTANKLKHGLSH